MIDWLYVTNENHISILIPTARIVGIVVERAASTQWENAMWRDYHCVTIRMCDGTVFDEVLINPSAWEILKGPFQ